MRSEARHAYARLHLRARRYEHCFPQQLETEERIIRVVEALFRRFFMLYLHANNGRPLPRPGDLREEAVDDSDYRRSAFEASGGYFLA